MREWIDLVESAEEHPWEKDVWEVRSKYENRWAGACEGAAAELADRLNLKGIEARVVCGAFDYPNVNDEGEENEYSSHCWVEIDGYILDPTVEQFDTDETIVPMNSEGAGRYLFGEIMESALITEEWFNTYTVDDNTIEVFKNPTRGEFFKLLADMEKQHGQSDWPLRAFITDSDLYVWDAYYATHSDMSRFKIPTVGGYLYLNREGLLFNDLNYEYGDDEEKPYGRWLRRYYEAAVSNPILRRIYGGEPKITGADDEGVTGLKGLFPVTREFIEKYVER